MLAFFISFLTGYDRDADESVNEESSKVQELSDEQLDKNVQIIQSRLKQFLKNKYESDDCVKFVLSLEEELGQTLVLTIEEMLENKQLFYTRHAESVQNLQSGLLNLFKINKPVLYDPPLTDKGRNQCMQLASHLNHQKIDFDLVILSPLQRVIDTYLNIHHSNSFKNLKRKPIITSLTKENSSLVQGMVGKHRKVLFDFYGVNFDFRYLNQGRWWRPKVQQDDEDENLIKSEQFSKETKLQYRSRLLIGILLAAIQPTEIKTILFVAHGVFFQCLNGYNGVSCPKNATLSKIEVHQIIQNLVKPILEQSKPKQNKRLK